jgi:uncharacterized protein (DUF433 family)
MEMFPGISMNPDVRFGKPCIVNRIDVATIVGLIAAGETVEGVAAEYQLSLEQVRAALAYPVGGRCWVDLGSSSAQCA